MTRFLETTVAIVLAAFSLCALASSQVTIQFSAPAQAQTNFPQVMPPQSLYGNTNPQSGPGFAVPLSLIASSLSLLFPATTSFAANAAVLASAAIPANVQYISTQSAGGCSLNYVRGGSSPVSPYGAVLNTVTNIYWEPLFNAFPVHACQFGTVADGVYNFNARATPTGTDNTQFIQNALDYAMRNGINTICLNDGYYKTTDTLAIGWGEAVRSVSLVACNTARSAYLNDGAGAAGVSILPTQTDRCAVNIAGGRQTKISGIQFLGQNRSFVINLVGNRPWATTAAGWLDPAITPSGSNPGGLTQFAPYSAICVDAYHSTQPSPTPYPAQTFPSWTGIASQYNQAASSDILITDVYIDGFGLCVNIMPNGDGNGDFVKMVNFGCVDSVYGASVGQSQARATTMLNVNCSNDYALLTNTKFGLQSGELGGNIINAACSQMFQLLDVNLSIAGLTVQDTYTEATVRIGSVTGANSMTFRNFKGTFEDTVTGVVMPALVEAAAGLTIKFDDAIIGNNSRIQALVHFASGATGSVVFSGGQINGGINVGALMGAIGAGGQNAVNYTGGLLAGAFVFGDSDFNNRLLWEGTTSASFMSTATGATSLSTSSWTPYPTPGSLTRTVFSQAMRGFVDALEAKYWTFSRGPGNQSIDLTGGSFPTALTSASCDTWTGQWLAGQQNSQNGNLKLGDIFYHQGTGTIFVVEVVGVATPTNFPVTLRQHNNMTVNTSGACVTNNLGAVPSGNSLQIHVTAPIPGQVFYCDFAAGSTALTNCSRGDGNGTQMSSVLSAGDKFWSGVFNDSAQQWPFLANATISSVTNGSPGSAALSNAAAKSGRFPLLPFPADIIGFSTNAIAALPTPSASGGSCAAAGAKTGNQVRGTVALSGSCVATNTVTLTFVIHAPVEWFCTLNDRTAPTILLPQTGSSATSATFTSQGTTGATDVLGFECAPY